MADPRVTATTVPPSDSRSTLVGRMFLPDAGPRIVAAHDGDLVDVTALGPTMADLLEREKPADDVAARCAERGTAQAWTLADVLQATASEADRRRGSAGAVAIEKPVLLSPVDLQVLKAAGVTFVRSMLERVIEERVGGDPTRAAEIRDQLADTLGASIRDIKPGSEEALAALDVLRENGLWSQYLQVGLGKHPEVFTKGAVLSSVGHGWDVSTVLEKRYHKGLWIKGAYHYGRAYNTIDPGSIATGSWTANQISDDPNNPGLSFASNSPGHRFFVAGSYTHDFFSFGTTNLALFWDTHTNGSTRSVAIWKKANS